jgi:hypothetical protein
MSRPIVIGVFILLLLYIIPRICHQKSPDVVYRVIIPSQSHIRTSPNQVNIDDELNMSQSTFVAQSQSIPTGESQTNNSHHSGFNHYKNPLLMRNAAQLS